MNEWVQICGYDFLVYPPNTNWSHTPGVYIFATPNEHIPEWLALYVGETEDFAERFSNHEHWQRAEDLGMTHILVLPEGDAAQRSHIEKILIERLQPQINVQLRK